MYKINSCNGFIFRKDGVVIEPPYDTEAYLEYAAWVNEGNQPEMFFEEPAVSVSLTATRFQVLAVLDQQGLFDRVDVLVNAPDTPRIHKLAWADATEFRRDSAFFAFLSQSLALSNERIDEIFKEAATLTG